ncbi:hypothetical protein AA313_de0208493 [Arthrobotrys entomopaga]|nr:hypothetical protein AA313_de0208493 [Arthrobotrys entomopaga]
MALLVRVATTTRMLTAGQATLAAWLAIETTSPATETYFARKVPILFQLPFSRAPLNPLVYSMRSWMMMFSESSSLTCTLISLSPIGPLVIECGAIAGEDLVDILGITPKYFSFLFFAALSALAAVRTVPPALSALSALSLLSTVPTATTVVDFSSVGWESVFLCRDFLEFQKATIFCMVVLLSPSSKSTPVVAL